MTSRRHALGAATGLLVSALGAPWPALAQTLGQGGGPDIPLWRVAGALIVCLALAVGGAFALRHRLPGGLILRPRPNRRLQPVETLRLSPHLDVHLFQLDHRELLVAATPQSAVLLVAGDAPESAAGPP